MTRKTRKTETTIEAAYRHLMDAAASAREARDAIEAGDPTPAAALLGRDIAARIEDLDALCERVEQALKTKTTGAGVGF